MTSIRTLILPLQDKKVIFPGAGISEVIKMDVLPIKGDTIFPWFMGSIDWRKKTIPVISLETFSDENIKPRFSNKPYMAILSSPFKSENYPFIGINLQNIPKLQKFKRDDLPDFKSHDDRLFDKSIFYKKDQLYILNIDELSALVEKLSKTYGT